MWSWQQSRYDPQAKLKEGCHASSFGPVYAELPASIPLRGKALGTSGKPLGMDCVHVPSVTCRARSGRDMLFL